MLLGFCGAGRVLLRLVRLPRGAAALGPLESWAPTGSWQEADRKCQLPVSVEWLQSRGSGPFRAGPGQDPVLCTQVFLCCSQPLGGALTPGLG